MTHWKLIRLNFGQTPAHFGEVGIGLEESRERVRSDTLFSALISSYARLFGTQKVEELLGNFQQSPCFRLSSTFIYRYQKAKYTYYLPKPLAFPKEYPRGKDDLEFTKTYKKLSYLPLEVWQRWYQGEGFTDSDRTALIEETKKSKSAKDSFLYQAGTFDYNQAFKIDKNPKVAIDRTTRSTNFYHTGFVHFESHPNEDKSKPEHHSGLYFILHFPTTNPHLEKEIHATLIFLGEEGLGGERSSGAGRFNLEWLDLTEEWKKVVQHQQSNHCLISLFWDDSISSELLNHGACYDIQERGGWIASSPSGYQKRRKMVRMFTEGSVFSACPQGKLANVTPERFKDHQVYRSGVSLSLPISINS